MYYEPQEYVKPPLISRKRKPEGIHKNGEHKAKFRQNA